MSELWLSGGGIAASRDAVGEVGDSQGRPGADTDEGRTGRLVVQDSQSATSYYPTPPPYFSLTQGVGTHRAVRLSGECICPGSGSRYGAVASTKPPPSFLPSPRALIAITSNQSQSQQ